MVIKYIDRATGKVMVENPPKEKLLRFLYGNHIGRKAFLPLAKRRFLTRLYGSKMNKSKSISKIQSFVDSLDIDMSEAEKSIDEFTSFNDFFYRKLKKGAREIQSGLVSPGDGKILAFKNYADVNTFYVKGRKFTLAEFLGDKISSDRYCNSSMIILRLAPNDYHRYHFPYDGVPTASMQIKGQYYSVSPHALFKHFTKVFVENKREITALDMIDNHRMLIVPVGATMVGSIFSTYKPNHKVKKGDEMGYFAFGGSTVVLLFQQDQFAIDKDLLQNTHNGFETYVQMGEKIGSPLFQ